MCGLVGLFAEQGRAPHRERWATLLDQVRHRGPDGGAFWADGPFFLGHRRLAILDLATGDQPMATSDGALVVVLNGEIYNFLELRAELESRGCRFRTQSDTEVLLHGYRLWGDDLPRRLVGMFAFAVADRTRRRVLLARDRFGEKPLLLGRGPGYWAFASEMGALTALPDLPRHIDARALGGYLSLNYVPGERTLLEAVRRVPPGSVVVLDSAGARTTRYWQPPPVPQPDAGRRVEATHVEVEERELREWRPLFDDAVRLCLRSDVPVGILLSGGIDSSLVAESAARQGRLARAYVLDFAEPTYSEYEAARQVADRLGVPLERVPLEAGGLPDLMDLAAHGDDPLADSSAVAVWVVCQAAARGNKVVLGGDGGDELYAGYLTYQATRLHDAVVRRLPPPLRRGLAALGARLPTSESKVSPSYRAWRFLRAASLPTAVAHLTWNGTWLPDEAAALVRGAGEREAVRTALAQLAAGHALDGRVSVAALQRLDISEYLPNDILAKVDRMSMAHGLETRAPFLNHLLAEWTLRRPAGHRLGRRGELKSLLRRAARSLYGPAIADRPKRGFSIPIHAWIRGPYREAVRELLSTAAIEPLGVLDPASVGRALEEHLAGRRSYGFEIWGMAVLSAWHRQRVAAPPPPPSSTAELNELTLPTSAG